jgi:Holliday junction resolvase RusA-like endonuclease
MGLIFKQFPMAPSVNQCYAGKTRRYATKELKQFKKEAELWALKNKEQIVKAKKLIQDQDWVEISIYICVMSQKLYTKKKMIKKWDASNRIKATLDALTKMLDKDDAHFFINRVEKVITLDQPHLMITLKPTTIKTEVQVLNELIDGNYKP